MTVKALYDYEFPSADRVENFGEDQLVYVHWRGNPLLCSAACFRAPRAMPFGPRNCFQNKSRRETRMTLLPGLSASSIFCI